jgi:ribosomal 30S subunit maturation factor RimM
MYIQEKGEEKSKLMWESNEVRQSRAIVCFQGVASRDLAAKKETL